MCYTRAMKRLRWFLLALMILLLGTGGMAEWAYAHRGYPNAVYYRRVEFRASSQTYIMHEWVDPARQVIRRRQEWLGSAGDMLIQHRRVYLTQLGASTYSTPVSPLVQRGLMYIFQGLKSGGFSGIGRQLLLHRVGQVTQVHDGKRLLRCFNSDGFDTDALGEIVCIDARTWLQVREQITLNYGSVVDAVYTQDKRLPPYALPADFFDLPHAHTSLWNQALDWAHQYAGLK